MFSAELELVPDSDRFYQTLTDIIVCMYIIAYLSSLKKSTKDCLVARNSLANGLEGFIK